MSDASITISYEITTITNNANGMSTVAWEMSEALTALTEVRAGDNFKTASLANGVLSTDSDYDKLVKLQANFEDAALPYFQAFAKRVRLAQDQAFTDLLETQTGDVEGLSVAPTAPTEDYHGALPPATETPTKPPKTALLKGTVKIAR